MTGHKASPAAARPPAPAAPAPLLVVGLGPAGPEHLAEAARRALRSSDRVVLRTRRHPSAEAFEALASFDHLYEESSGFDEVYRRIVEDLVASARAAREADEAPPVYAVPGSPMVAERTVELLRADPRVAVQVVPALSFLDLAWAVLGVDPLAAGVRLVDGVRFATEAAGRAARCWSPSAGRPRCSRRSSSRSTPTNPSRPGRSSSCTTWDWRTSRWCRSAGGSSTGCSSPTT